MTAGDPPESFAAVYEGRDDATNPVLELLRRYGPGRRTVLGVAVVSTVVWRLANLAAPYLLGVALDTFFVSRHGLTLPLVPGAWIPSGTRAQFLFLLGVFVAVGVGNVAANAARLLSWRWFQQSVVHDLRVDTFEATQRLSVAFFDSERTGDVMSVLNNDVNQLRELLDDGLQTLLQLFAFLVALIAVMVALHWQLTLVALAFAPVMVGVVYAYQRAVEPRYDNRRSAVGRLNAHLQGVVDGIETVKAFTAEPRERDRLTENSRSFWRADWHAARLSALFFPARQAVSVATMLTLVGVGGWWALFGPPAPFDRPLSVGTFVTFYFYGQMFVAQSARVGDVADTYTDAKASAKRVFGLLDHPRAVVGDETATPLESVDGQVAYEDVTFTYPDADDPAVDGVSFTAEPGDFVGVVGPTGAGKSTLLKLLLRFYDPDSGTVRVDGTPVDTTTAESLRDAVGYVSQDPFLFDGTVAENIAYGATAAGGAYEHGASQDEEVAPGVRREAVVEAAKRANAHGFVSELPDGYDTEVGERGVKLSGGQRQRIAIARVAFDDPDILVLDEATSHVDTLTELLVQESLQEVVAGRTTFAVAHRLSTVRHADQILVLDDGELVERGTHDELVDRGGLYASLWNVHVGSADSVPDDALGVATPPD